MCGVVGVYDFARARGEIDDRLLTDMRETLHHRGPDGEGMWVSPDRRVGLGHRRLSIVDPAGGSQPMFGQRGEVLVFNGEIYNYPSLRRDLERRGVGFTTNCDTEVILHLYAMYAEGCLSHLNGMFAIALWDPERERLFLARDRVGEKPLYWASVGGTLVFGSEIKALIRHPLVKPEVNSAALGPYLANLVTPGPETLYLNVNKLAPGTMALCDREGVRVSRYWNLFEPRDVEACDPREAAATLRGMLERSVDMRLMSDVPLGVLLSGGVDSSTLVALLRDKAKGLASFSVGFSDKTEIDERSEARRAAAHFGTDHHEVSISERDALAFLPKLVHHQDEPLADPVCIPLYFVCRLAIENGVKVVLAGEGADELFWGYPRYSQVMGQWPMLRALLRLPGPVRRALPHLIPPVRKPRLRDFAQGIAAGRLAAMHAPLGLSASQRGGVLGQRADSLGWAPSAARAETDPLTTLMFDTQEYEFGLRLPELLLMRIDRFSMANSVEARVPFLDPDIVEFVYRLPLDQKLHEGITKLILKRAVSDAVPEWILSRKKQGFGAPISDWFGTKLGELFATLIGDDCLRRYFATESLRELLREHRNGGENSWTLWPILNFALWHKYWIEGESLSPLLEPLGVGV